MSPGVYRNIPELEYHALPGLSSTGVKTLLDSPARYQWERQHRTEKKAFDLGHLIHGMALGVGLGVKVVDAPDWRTKAAREERDAARAGGLVPVLTADYERAEQAVAKVRQHPDASPLLTGGAPEVSLLWDDPDTGVRCRGRLDYWHNAAGLVVDLKTTGQTSDPRRVSRVAASLGWHQQASHYSDGVEVLTGTRPRFLHVVVEVDPPHHVSVVELHAANLALGAADVRTARDIYARCEATGEWPAYPQGIHRIAPPRWLAATEDLEFTA
jgi:hypothetical protein